MSIDFKIFQALEKNIIDAGLCKGCGTCVLACEFEFIKMENNIPVYIGKSVCANCGMCLYICPSISKSSVNISKSLNKPLFYQARSNDIDFTEFGQVAGVTNTLAYTALMKGIKAIRSLKEGENITDIQSFNAYNKDQLLEGSGGKFFLAPISVEVDDPNKQEIESNLFIGLPCTLSSINTLQKYKFKNLNEIIKIKIGLFCRGILDPDKFKDFIIKRNLDLNSIIKINYFKKKNDQRILKLKLEKENVSINLEEKEWSQLVWEGCQYCHDFLAESSDLSIGWEGVPPGWQSIVVFTEIGNELLKFAINKKLLEIEPLPQESVKELNRIHELKDKNAKFV
ncbi:MAG: Coenzyme F420 hydrogenase subunit beta [Candidatus Heimdallarchaeota archaeon LC_3]|nr:MAG: Coenzyme F420 hydrogenase subunit beta [Candidatus Heimdallarchaeota archaeon LC_3]